MTIQQLQCESCPLADRGVAGAVVPCRPVREALYENADADRYPGIPALFEAAVAIAETRSSLEKICLESMIENAEKPDLSGLPVGVQYRAEGIAQAALQSAGFMGGDPGKYIDTLFLQRRNDGTAGILAPAMMAIMGIEDPSAIRR